MWSFNTNGKGFPEDLNFLLLRRGKKERHTNTSRLYLLCLPTTTDHLVSPKFLCFEEEMGFDIAELHG
jgi:hypothetical protein